jgi:aminopeptidase N
MRHAYGKLEAIAGGTALVQIADSGAKACAVDSLQVTFSARADRQTRSPVTASHPSPAPRRAPSRWGVTRNCHSSRNVSKFLKTNSQALGYPELGAPSLFSQCFHHLGRDLSKFSFLALLSLLPLTFASTARADRPYAPSRDFDLQNIRTHLWFDIKHRAIRGEVTETVSSLRDNVSQLSFDSTGLDISAVTVDGATAPFTVTSEHLIVSLSHPAARGDRHDVFIRYSGQPKKGIFFILPDKNYPHQPVEIWTQGEAEDTHAYIPIDDYPNTRTTSEMILTVPASWTTVSNGQLLSVQNDSDGTKTWDWKQSQPLSTYLISAIAGDFVEHDDTWNGVQLRYLVPRGDQADLGPTFVRTKAMLELFTQKLSVPYPWPQYAQTSVDDFTEGGMENTSAATLSTNDLVNPLLESEYRVGADDVNSHELSHQWFGDLVTCKDWANLWLNEGFATFFENFWLEHKNGADAVAYEYWQEQNRWFREKRLFTVPVFTRDFTESTQYDGNTYFKAGWVVKMLREKLGDDQFFAALHHYLEANRGQNVVTADLQKAIEQSTSVNVDRFFHQWIYRAGAPEFNVAYSYDSSAHEVKLDVKQNQKVEGLVGLFDVPIDVEIDTAAGRKTYPIQVQKSEQTFTFPSNSEPLMMLFDPGDQLLKNATFEKTPAMLIYQLKNAESVPDRADAAVALAKIHDDPAVIPALGDAAKRDPFWGVRVEALHALGKLGGADAEKSVLVATADPKPWVREVAAAELAHFASDSAVAPKLVSMATADPAYLVRAAALRALAQAKSSPAFDVLVKATKTNSPDDVVRRAALSSFGTLGDTRAISLLLDWSSPGKPFRCRQSAIASLAVLDKANPSITRTLISYLHEPYFDLQVATILALARRGDPAATEPLQAMLHGQELTTVEEPFIQTALNMLQNKGPAE